MGDDQYDNLTAYGKRLATRAAVENAICCIEACCPSLRQNSEITPLTEKQLKELLDIRDRILNLQQRIAFGESFGKREEESMTSRTKPLNIKQAIDKLIYFGTQRGFNSLLHVCLQGIEYSESPVVGIEEEEWDEDVDGNATFNILIRVPNELEETLARTKPVQHEPIIADCFFCGRHTDDAIDDGFVPDFVTVMEDEKNFVRHCNSSCPGCQRAYLYTDDDGERYLQTVG